MRNRVVVWSIAAGALAWLVLGTILWAPTIQTDGWSENLGLLTGVVGSAVAATAFAVHLIRRDRGTADRHRGRNAHSTGEHFTGADDGVRTEFGRAPGMLAKLLLAMALSAVSVAGAVALAVFAPMISILLVAGIMLVLVPITIIMVKTLPIIVRVSAFSVDADGVHMRMRRRGITIPWSDIESWWVGVPPGGGDRFVGRQVIFAVPAAHVHDPAHGDRRMLWSSDYRGWRLCDPQLTDGTIDEVTAAFAHFAPAKRSAAPAAPNR